MSFRRCAFSLHVLYSLQLGIAKVSMAGRIGCNPVRSAEIIYVHDTGGLGETAVVNFNAGQEVETMLGSSVPLQLPSL